MNIKCLNKFKYFSQNIYYATQGTPFIHTQKDKIPIIELVYWQIKELTTYCCGIYIWIFFITSKQILLCSVFSCKYCLQLFFWMLTKHDILIYNGIHRRSSWFDIGCTYFFFGVLFQHQFLSEEDLLFYTLQLWFSILTVT